MIKTAYNLKLKENNMPKMLSFGDDFDKVDVILRIC